jgi:hypothetical protein
MKLSNLTKKRLEHIKSCRDNNDNSHEIIAGLYSDPSHFIYELLQNADDAGASEVIFKLESQSLSITHNGKKLFNFDDVDSITTVGSSTKKDDINSIGTFGAGFKSVFAVTKKPIIHSGDFHFQINDFIVPKEIEPIDIKNAFTKIILPFDHIAILPNTAYKQISDRLQALESESLLFLRSIKDIQWRTESDRGHYLSDINGNKASLISQINNEDTLKQYFLVTKNIEVDSTRLNIVVAYPLNSDGIIIPAHESKLFVFFPTNERTGFRFLVHAPYKTTPSRESIPFDDTQNQAITASLSALIAESIIDLKNSGLLSVEALSMLPINSDNEHPLYRSAFQHVISIFSTKQLLPTSDGGFKDSSNTLLARERELTNLLLNEDCLNLFNRESWLHTGITYDKTRLLRDYLTGELDIPEITMQKFCSEITEEFILTKSDEWLIEFYSGISKNKALYRPGINSLSKGVLRERPIIRLEDNTHVCPENDSGELQVYLPSKGQSKFKTVKKDLIADEESYEFLKSLGLKEPSKIAEIKEFIIPKYQGAYIQKDEYFEDFQRVLNIWLESDEYRRREVIDLIKQSKFMHCKSQEGRNRYESPNNVYFKTDKLASWFKSNTTDDIYFLDLPSSSSDAWRKFAEALGVRYDLRIFGSTEIRVNRNGWYQRSVNGFNPEFNLHGLKFSLNNITYERSILLWSLLLKYVNKLKGHIESKTNQNYPYKKGEELKSTAMSYLEKCSWLYDKDQVIISLSIDHISLSDLNDEYPIEEENTEKLVKILDLKLDEIIEFEEKTGKKVISLEDYDLLQQLKSEQEDSEKNNQDDDWTPTAEPEQTIPFIDPNTEIEERKPEDLSGQTTTKGNNENGDESNEDNDNSIKPSDKKAIGDWGEKVASIYLNGKYPDQDVICLNDSGSKGKGYDFVIRDNGNDFAYYEVKSKIDESPQLFQISGTQWNWAKQLSNKNKGDMYKILLISNAGTLQPTIKEIKNPVTLWRSEKIYADPINIEL